MEKQSFETLFKQAWKRSGEGRFLNLVVLEALIGFALLLPCLAVTVYTIGKFVVARNSGAEPPLVMLLWAVPAAILLLFAGAWLGQAITSGVAREALEAPPSCAGRAFREGFSRWLAVLFPLPWVIGAAFVTSIVNFVLRFANPLAAATTQQLLNLAIGVVTSFLYAAVSAEPVGTGITPIYEKTFLAVKNGWGRMILGQLVIAGVWIVAMFICLPGVVCCYLGRQRGDDGRSLLIAGAAIFAVWLILLIVTLFRLTAFKHCYYVLLYADAARGGVPDAPSAVAETVVPPAEAPAPPEKSDDTEA